MEDFWIALFCIVPDFSQYITTHIFSLVINHFNYDFENIKIGELISKTTKMPDILLEYSNVFRIDFLKQLFIFIAAFVYYSKISNRNFREDSVYKPSLCSLANF